MARRQEDRPACRAGFSSWVRNFLTRVYAWAIEGTGGSLHRMPDKVSLVNAGGGFGAPWKAKTVSTCSLSATLPPHSTERLVTWGLPDTVPKTVHVVCIPRGNIRASRFLSLTLRVFSKKCTVFNELPVIHQAVSQALDWFYQEFPELGSRISWANNPETACNHRYIWVLLPVNHCKTWLKPLGSTHITCVASVSK